MARYPAFVLRADFALIGGTGIGPLLEALPGVRTNVPTEAGMLRGRLVTVDGAKVFCVQRHSGGHKTPPHLVGYRAIALGLRHLGVRGCVSSAAVGCLRRAWPVGTLVACSDFLDFSGRRQTLFDREVRHTDFSDPFPLRGQIVAAARAASVDVVDGGVYLCCDGPRYETPAEIAMYGKLGADLVGMTASTEAVLMREAGVPYGCLAVVSNLAAGLSDGPLSHGEVTDVMKVRGGQVVQVMLAAAKAGG